MSTTTVPAVLRKLESWLEAHGYELETGAMYACWTDDKIVTYRKNDPAETQLHGVLHECGHVLVGRTVARGRGTRYLRGYPSTRTRKARSNVSAADLVHEEIEAWHRGYNLARRLHIRVNARAYWREYGACIKHYFRRMVARRV